MGKNCESPAAACREAAPTCRANLQMLWQGVSCCRKGTVVALTGSAEHPVHALEVQEREGCVACSISE